PGVAGRAAGAAGRHLGPGAAAGRDHRQDRRGDGRRGAALRAGVDRLDPRAGALRSGRAGAHAGPAQRMACALMFLPRRRVRIETERMILRPPVHADFRAWSGLRQDSAGFLQRWEPTWAADHLTRKGFANRVYWAQRSVANGTALPMFLIRR